MKGQIKEKDIVYKITSKSLNKEIEDSYSKENIKLPLNCEATFIKDTKISLKIFNDKITTTTFLNVIPEKAIKTPITKERIEEQLLKTGNTPFKFNNISINLSENTTVPISSINELRRNALTDFEISFKKNYQKLLKEFKLNDFANKNINTQNKKISILLNEIKTDYNYKNIKNVDSVYIPFKFFINKTYTEKIKELNNIYIFFPNITRKNYMELIRKNLENIINGFNIKGFVISNIGQLDLVKKYNLDLIANYTLNIYSDYTAKFMKDLGLGKLTISPELNKETINNLSSDNLEVIAYGRQVLMTSSYCTICEGKTCTSPCQKNDIYKLKDRLRI